MKSNEKSKILREIGNQFYAKRSFFDAILKYNESLCYAEKESENAGLAYANRSAVYFEMKIYEKSLINIELAKANNYPKENFEILKRREVKCNEMMKNTQPSNDDLDYFKLSCNGYENFPSIANCLEAKCDEKFGRHVITNRNLSTGDVIVIEEPFCKVLKQEFVYQKCSNCFQSNLLDLQPCFSCNRAMFCSSACRKTALKIFHLIECPIMQSISSSTINSNMRIALRIFIMSLSIFDNSIDDLVNFFNENSSRSATIFDFERQLSVKEKLLAINSLNYEGDYDINDAVIEELFQSNEKLQDMWVNHKEFIKNFIQKQTKFAMIYCHEIYGWPLKRGGLNINIINNNENSQDSRHNIVPFGNGSYSFCSLLNHSCAPNVQRIFIDDKIVLIVRRQIDAGCQIFDNYGYQFTNYKRDFRQAVLLKQYKFLCECEMCVNNVGLLPSLKVCDKSHLKQAQRVYDEIPNLNQKKAKQCLREIAKTIQVSKNFPSIEICSLMESFASCLEIILKPKILFP